MLKASFLTIATLSQFSQISTFLSIEAPIYQTHIGATPEKVEIAMGRCSLIVHLGNFKNPFKLSKTKKHPCGGKENYV